MKLEGVAPPACTLRASDGMKLIFPASGDGPNWQGQFAKRVATTPAHSPGLCFVCVQPHRQIAEASTFVASMRPIRFVPWFREWATKEIGLADRNCTCVDLLPRQVPDY